LKVPYEKVDLLREKQWSELISIQQERLRFLRQLLEDLKKDQRTASKKSFHPDIFTLPIYPGVPGYLITFIDYSSSSCPPIEEALTKFALIIFLDMISIYARRLCINVIFHNLTLQYQRIFDAIVVYHYRALFSMFYRIVYMPCLSRL
jgi:hypothetical protein